MMEELPEPKLMDLLAAARRWERHPPLDSTDGSASWFEMRHEEAVLLDDRGRPLARVRAGADPHVIAYPRASLLQALDGGLVMHAHTLDQGESFSAADLLLVVSLSQSLRGCVLVVTTTHPVEGRDRPVRYIADSRQRGDLPVEAARAAFLAFWDSVDEEIAATLEHRVRAGMSDAELAELMALHRHMVVDRVCKEYGIEYRREVVR